MDLFQDGFFLAHSGKELSFKVECDALTDGDLDTLARLIGEKFHFSEVYGIPRGGLRLAERLKTYCVERGPLLIVDDVLTTGRSMEEAYRKYTDRGARKAIGIVIFARGACPGWIHPIFTLARWVR